MKKKNSAKYPISFKKSRFGTSQKEKVVKDEHKSNLTFPLPTNSLSNCVFESSKTLKKHESKYKSPSERIRYGI